MKRPAFRWPDFAGMWRRLRAVFSRPAMWTLILAVGLVLFHWPYLSPAGDWDAYTIHHFIFAAWLVIILLLLLVALSLFNPKDGSR
jgi:hypothetical protein